MGQAILKSAGPYEKFKTTTSIDFRAVHDIKSQYKNHKVNNKIKNNHKPINQL